MAATDTTKTTHTDASEVTAADVPEITNGFNLIVDALRTDGVETI